MYIDIFMYIRYIFFTIHWNDSCISELQLKTCRKYVMPNGSARSGTSREKWQNDVPMTRHRIKPSQWKQSEPKVATRNVSDQIDLFTPMYLFKFNIGCHIIMFKIILYYMISFHIIYIYNYTIPAFRSHQNPSGLQRAILELPTSWLLLSPVSLR